MTSNLLTGFRSWVSAAVKRLDPASEQILLNAGLVLPDGNRPPPNARTPEAAMRNSAVYSCVRLPSEIIASLPLRVVETATKKPAVDHPVSRLLQEPNAEQTLPEFLEMFLANYFTWGVAYCDMVKRGGRVVELIPFAAGCTEAVRQNGRVFYNYKVPGTGQIITLDDEQVLAFRMFGFNDALKSFAPIWIAQRAIELALTQEQTARENFADGLRPDIIVQLPPEKVLERLATGGVVNLVEEHRKIQNQIAGARTRRELYLPYGYSSTPYSANYQQSQFQETRDFQILEIARVWRVPPSKLGVISKQPNANVEQDQLSFFQDTIRPVLAKLEKRLERDLLSPAERGRFEIRFMPRAILRGDIKTQTDQYTRLFQVGVYSRNEIRDFEDLPPIEGGDEYMVPTNMTTEQIGGADQSGTNPEARMSRDSSTGRALVCNEDDGCSSQPPGSMGANAGASAAAVIAAKPEAARRGSALPEGGQDPLATTARYQLENSATRKPSPLTEAQQRSLKGRKAAAEGVKGAFAEAIRKVVKAEKARVLKETKSILGERSRENLRDRLEQLYSANGELTKFVKANVQAPIRALFDALVSELRKELDTEFSDADLNRMVKEYQRIWVRDYTHSSLFQLQDVIDETEGDDDLAGAIEQRLNEWENGTSDENPTRAEKESAGTTHNGTSVFTKGLYVLAGVAAVQIVGGTCDLCEPLQGSYNVNNAPTPPFHRGCGCDLVSG